MAGTGEIRVPSPAMPQAPRQAPSGAAVKPAVIRAMLHVQKAYEEAGKQLDRLLIAVGEEARSGRPPPPTMLGRHQGGHR
jgi:hypothetical protein